MRLLFFFFLFSFVLSSCKEKCDATIPLHRIEIGKKLLPYELQDTLCFINSFNDTAFYYFSVLELGMEEIDIGLMCPVIGEDRFGILEKLTPAAINEISSFRFLVDVANLNISNPMDTLLANRIFIHSLDVESGLQGFQNNSHHKLTLFQPRGSSAIPPEFESSISFFEEISIGDTAFEEVYKSGETPNCLYYNLNTGIVGFEDGNSTLWVLKK